MKRLPVAVRPVKAAVHVRVAAQLQHRRQAISWLTIRSMAWARVCGRQTYTRIMSRCLRAQGLVWVNCYADGDITVPFGGVKQSGSGATESLHALEKYSDLKTDLDRSDRVRLGRGPGVCLASQRIPSAPPYKAGTTRQAMHQRTYCPRCAGSVGGHQARSSAPPPATIARSFAQLRHLNELASADGACGKQSRWVRPPRAANGRCAASTCTAA